MEDNNIYNDSDVIDNNNVSKQNKEVGADVGNDKNRAESKEAVPEELSPKGETNATEETEPQLEKNTDDSEAANTQEQIFEDSVKRDSAEYVWSSSDQSRWGNDASSSVYHFKPDNMKEYVGRKSEGYSYSSAYSSEMQSGGYSSAQNQQDPKERKTRKKGRSKRALIISLVALMTALALVAGGAIGYMLADRDVPDVVSDTTGSEAEQGEISMTKNNERVEVRIEEGSTGYTALARMEVIELVADAVVEITTSTVQTNSFFGGNYVTSGAGSGVVIAQNDTYAYVVTNYHVIEGADSVDVTLTDKTVVSAEYLDGDASNDIAMLRIKTDKTFPKIVCGSSDSLKVGEDVIAIGNPLGQLGGTVTEGIVSAVDRAITIDGITMNLIQTSAAVNPGNSGGGLFNMAGELVGIVNAKQSAEGIEGLGFAIPIDSVYDMLVEIIETKYIHGRPTIGIEVEYVSDPWVARMRYGVSTTGIFVTSSANDQLKSKDMIRSINGQLISDNSSYAAVVSQLEIGKTVTVEVYRGGKLTAVEVEVTEYVPEGIFG